MTDQTAFLRARLNEDRQWAQLTRSSWDQPEWRDDHGDVFAVGGARMAQTRSANVAPHIARHDPARVLREVKAKRAILRQLEHSLSYKQPVPVGKRGEWALASLILDALLLPYSDHPDYRQEWAAGG